MPSPCLAPGNPAAKEYLYIAACEGAPSNEYKVGWTRTPQARQKQLAGQTDAVFRLLRVLPALSGRLAEKLTFATLDAMNARKYPGTRKELFICELDQLVKFCEAAVHQANVETVRQNALLPSAPTGMQKKSALLAHPDSFWQELLRMPLKYEQMPQTLGQVLGKSLRSNQAARYLEQRGARCTCTSNGVAEFEIDWHRASKWVDWAKTRGYTDPLLFNSSVSFSVKA